MAYLAYECGMLMFFFCRLWPLRVQCNCICRACSVMVINTTAAIWKVRHVTQCRFSGFLAFTDNAGAFECVSVIKDIKKIRGGIHCDTVTFKVS